MPKHRGKKGDHRSDLLLYLISKRIKSAVLNSLTWKSGQRTYDHAINEFVDWYCSEPRLAFNRTVVLRYRIHLEAAPRSNNHQPPAWPRSGVAYARASKPDRLDIGGEEAS